MGDYELDEIQNAHEVTRAIGGRFWSEETLYFQARVEAIGRKLLADRNAGKADAEARIAELEAEVADLRSLLSRGLEFVEGDAERVVRTLDRLYQSAGAIVPDACCDKQGQHYGIASVRELIADEMRRARESLPHERTPKDERIAELEAQLSVVRSELSALRPLSAGVTGSTGAPCRMKP